MKMTDETLFSRIKMLNASGAAKAIKRSLEDSELDEECADFESHLELSSSGPWHSVTSGLESLLEKYGEHELLIEGMDAIISLCRQRSEEEDAARSDLRGSEALALWHEVMHLGPSRLKRRLETWLADLELSKVVDIDGDTRLYGRWQGLIQTVRSTQRSSGPSWKPRPEDWEDVLIYLAKRKNAPTPECDIFGKCEFCWRFVPLARSTGHNHLYCEQHQWNTKEYKRALEIRDLHENEHIDVPIGKLVQRSRERLRLDKSNLPDGWEPLFANDIVRLTEMVAAPVDYDPVLLEEYFPHVFAFVRSQDKDTASPADIVAALDPIPEDAQGDIRKRWQALHHVFAHNLLLFRRELCHAEIFLNDYQSLFAGVRRWRPLKKAP